MIAGSGTKNHVATNLSTDEPRGVLSPKPRHFSQPSTALDVRCDSICALPPLERSLRRNSVGGLARSVFAGAETKQNRRIGFASAALASAGTLVGDRKMRGANDAWEPLPSTSPSPSRAYRECDSSRFCFRGEGAKKSLLAHEMPPEPSYKDTPPPSKHTRFCPQSAEMRTGGRTPCIREVITIGAVPPLVGCGAPRGRFWIRVSTSRRDMIFCSLLLQFLTD
jgi:hypothetical protein